MNSFNNKQKNSINYINIAFGIFFSLIIAFSFCKFLFIGEALDIFVFNLLFGQFKYIFYIFFLGLIFYSFIKKGNVSVWKMFLLFLFFLVLYISIYIIFYKAVNFSQKPEDYFKVLLKSKAGKNLIISNPKLIFKIREMSFFKKILFSWKVDFLNLKNSVVDVSKSFNFKMQGSYLDFFKNLKTILDGFKKASLLQSNKLIFDTFNILSIKATNKITLLIPCLLLIFNFVIFGVVIYFRSKKYNRLQTNYNNFKSSSFDNLKDFNQPYYSSQKQGYTGNINNNLQSQNFNNFNQNSNLQKPLNNFNSFSNLNYNFNAKNSLKKQYLDPNEIFNKEIIRDNNFNNSQINRNSLLDQNNMLVNNNNNIYNSPINNNQLNNNPLNNVPLNNIPLNNNNPLNNVPLNNNNNFSNTNNNLNNNILNSDDLLVNNNNYQNNVNQFTSQNIQPSNKILNIVNKVTEMIKNFGVQNIENAIFSLDSTLQQNEVNEILKILKIRKLI